MKDTDYKRIAEYEHCIGHREETDDILITHHFTDFHLSKQILLTGNSEKN